jgi:hypothetical protein
MVHPQPVIALMVFVALFGIVMTAVALFIA